MWGTRAGGRWLNVALNASAPGTGNAGRDLARFGLTADINLIAPYKTVTYDALQSQIVKRWGGSQLGFVYTFSKCLNYADNDANPRIQWMPEAQRNRGPASYDRPHNLQTYWMLESPFGKGRKGSTPDREHAARQLAVERPAQRPERAAVYITQKRASTSMPFHSQSPTRSSRRSRSWEHRSRQAVLRHLRLLAQVNIPANQPQRFGNAGRNNVRGPGFFNTDRACSAASPSRRREAGVPGGSPPERVQPSNFALGCSGTAITMPPIPRVRDRQLYVGGNNASGFSAREARAAVPFGMRVSC